MNKEMTGPRNRHLNLFHTYGTAHLEDNVTRALIITLTNLAPVNLRLFLNEVVLAKTRSKRQEVSLFAPPDFEFDLQVTSPQQGPEDERLTPRTGVLLGITYGGKQALVFEATPAEGGGVDPILRRFSGSDKLMPCGSECVCLYLDSSPSSSPVVRVADNCTESNALLLL